MSDNEIDLRTSMIKSNNQILLDWINTLSSSKCLLVSSIEDLYDGEILYDIFNIILNGYKTFLELSNITEDDHLSYFNNWFDFESSEEFYCYLKNLITEMNTMTFQEDEYQSEKKVESYIPKSEEELFCIIKSLKQLNIFFQEKNSILKRVLKKRSNEKQEQERLVKTEKLTKPLEGNIKYTRNNKINEQNDKFITKPLKTCLNTASFFKKGLSFKIESLEVSNTSIKNELTNVMGKRLIIKLGNFSCFSNFEVFGFNLPTKLITNVDYSNKKFKGYTYYYSINNNLKKSSNNKLVDGCKTYIEDNKISSYLDDYDLTEPLPSSMGNMNNCK